MADLWTPLSDEEQIRNLFDLGYFSGKGWDEVRGFMFGSAVVQDRLAKYADFHGLKDEQPSEHMLRPRCGLPDFARSPEEAAMSKWRMLDVTTSHRLSGLNPLSAEREHQLWLAADAAWNAVCGIRLKHIDDMNTANIYANPGATGAGVLAWSYLPNNSGPEDQMQQLYNRATNWSERLLLQVMIHEKGHAIGLDHGPAGSLMQPTAGGDITAPQAWDIAQAQLRYGKPGPLPPSPPTEEFALRMRTRLTPGRYEIQSAEAGDYDFELMRPVGAGRYRAKGEFEG